MSLFKSKYNNIISFKIIYDSFNNISKGYGFLEVGDKDEYYKILKNEEHFSINDRFLTKK